MTDQNTNATILKEENLPANTEINPSILLQMAVSKDLDITKLEKLMEMKDLWDKKQARKNYYEAVSKFQSIVPELTKSKLISFGQTKYKFAPLGEIEAQIKESMYECGLSKRWELSYPDNKIQCDCIITHKDGHSEHTIMLGEKDTSGNKNLMQQNASAVTYLQRYTLISALGLATADEDNDATTAGDKGTAPESNQDTARPTEWLNEGTDAWKEMQHRIEVGGESNDAVLKDMKNKWRVNKKCEEAIIAMKKNPAYLANAKQSPAAEKPAPTGKAKPKLTQSDNLDWIILNQAIPKTDFTKQSPVMKAYNNNVAKLSSGEVALKTVADAYDLDEDVLLHYTAIAKRKE